MVILVTKKNIQRTCLYKKCSNVHCKQQLHSFFISIQQHALAEHSSPIQHLDAPPSQPSLLYPSWGALTHSVISQKLNYSLLPICKTGKIMFLCFYTDALIPSNSMTYVPVTVPYLCSYTCRTKGLSRNQTSGSFPFRICKFLS